MRLQTRHFYEFGPFRLEPAEQLLRHGDQPISLAPKAFELLVFLVQSEGRLVSKDQIMQAVWQGSFVEEANLTVSISVLRRVLAEKEGGLRFIETIPKRGYRFTAPVREVGGPTEVSVDHGRASSQRSDIDTDKEPALGFGKSFPSQPKRESESSGSPLPAGNAQPHGDKRGAVILLPLQGSDGLESAAEPGRAEVLHAKLGKRTVVTGLAILLSALVALSIVFLRRPSARDLRGPRSLAILPLQNLRQDSNEDFLGFSLADAVITKLGYVSSLTVRPSYAVQRYRNQVIDIGKVGTDLNVDTLLAGSFIRDGDDLRITYQLIDVKTEKILGRGTIDEKYDKLLKVQDDVAQQIIKGLEVNLSPSEAERIKPDAPVNPVAYEYYLRGVDLHGQHKFPMAIKMLEKSTEIDPNYASAWAYLGASYTSDAAFEFGGREQYRRAQASYERALAIQPSQLDAQIFLANLLVDTGKVEQAVPLLRDALKTNPNHAGVHWELGYAYRFAGMLNESVAECERARQIDPLVKANGSVLNAYLYLGEYEKFIASLPEVNDSAFLLFYRGFGEYHQKNWDQAARDFDRAFDLDPYLYSQIGKAVSDSIAHKNAEGLEILHAIENKIGERGVGDPEAMYKIAQAYSILGDKAAALRVLRNSVEGGFFSYPYLAADPLLNALRKEPEFAEILNVSRRRYQEFRDRFF